MPDRIFWRMTFFLFNYYSYYSYYYYLSCCSVREQCTHINNMRPIATAWEVPANNAFLYHVCAPPRPHERKPARIHNPLQPATCLRYVYTSKYIYSIFNIIYPCRNLMIMPLAFIRQDAISALAVDNLQVSALKTSRAFDCEDYISPNNAHRELFIHCALLHACICALHPYSRSFWLWRLSLTQQPAWGITRSFCHMLVSAMYPSIWS